MLVNCAPVPVPRYRSLPPPCVSTNGGEDLVHQRGIVLRAVDAGNPGESPARVEDQPIGGAPLQLEQLVVAEMGISTSVTSVTCAGTTDAATLT